MKIISFDPSLRHTGFYWHNGIDGNSGVIEPTGERIDSLAQILMEVSTITQNLTSEWVCVVEGYAFAAKGQAVTVQAEVGGIIRAVARLTGMHVIEIAPQQWKAEIMGAVGCQLKKRTKAEIAEYLKWVHLSTSATFITTHEADAYMMAEYIRRRNSIKELFPKEAV